MAPPLVFGHGFDAPQGSSSSWSDGYVQCKPIQVDKSCVATHIGMRFAADISQGVRVRSAIFSEVDVSGVKRPDKMLMDCPVYEGEGTGEAGVRNFKLNKDLKLSAGGYFILVIWSSNPGATLDYKADSNGCSFYVGSQSFDDAFESWAGQTMNYTEYNSNWGYWILCKALGGDRRETEAFVKAMEEHLKPSEAKSYFPARPDGWDELDEKQGCFQMMCELGLIHSVKYMIDQYYYKCAEGRLCDKDHQLVNVGTTMDNGWICSAIDDKNGTCKRNCVVEDEKGQTAGWTRYHCAQCDFNLCDQCWEKKIDINFIGPEGLAPLHVAAYYGHVAVAAALVEAKADLEVRTGDALLGSGRTPLLLAALGHAAGSHEVLDLLLAKGADVNSEDTIGSNALQLAATRGGPLAAGSLIKTNKVDIDHQDSMGYSALLNAAHYGQSEVFSMLVKQRASLKLRTKEGKNAMHLCTQHNRPAVLQLLMDAEAFSLMEEKDNLGATPLDLATEMRNPEILSYMSAAFAGLGKAVNIGTEAGDGARHVHEANKVSCTRVLVPYPNVTAAQVGIHWDASNDWKGEGELAIAVFAETAEGEPDFSKCLAECKGRVNASENRGHVVYYPLPKPVPLTKGAGYWVAFSATIDTIVEKDSRIKLLNRRYAQHDCKQGWNNLPKTWKKNMCTPAVFIRTAAKEQKRVTPCLILK